MEAIARAQQRIEDAEFWKGQEQRTRDRLAQREMQRALDAEVQAMSPEERMKWYSEHSSGE